MKKILLTLNFAFISLFASAQCSPDPQITLAGIHPDSAMGLADAYVGQPYFQNITIITPTDTDVVYLGQAINVTIDNIDLTSVTGLPSSFSYSCDPPTCSFPGGSTKCAELSSAGPTTGEIGLHQIIFETTSYVSGVPFIGTTTQDDVIDYYYLEVLENATSTINHFDYTTFKLQDPYPNPVVNQARIQFVTGSSENITFRVFNLLGVEIDRKLLSSSRGVNTIELNTSLYSDGVYLYSIDNGSSFEVKRMVVKN